MHAAATETRPYVRRHIHDPWNTANHGRGHHPHGWEAARQLRPRSRRWSSSRVCAARKRQKIDATTCFDPEIPFGRQRRRSQRGQSQHEWRRVGGVLKIGTKSGVQSRWLPPPGLCDWHQLISAAEGPQWPRQRASLGANADSRALRAAASPVLFPGCECGFGGGLRWSGSGNACGCAPFWC